MGIFGKCAQMNKVGITTGKVSPALWLGVPLFLIAMVVFIEQTVDGSDLDHMFSEGGPVEDLQFYFMVASTLLAGLLAFQAKDPLTKVWALLLCAGSFYIAGEEVSWGQHIFDWATPGFWSGVNDQNETNLHNTSAWFDQKPRLILFIGMIVGGLVFPALRRWKPSALPTKFAAFYPTDYMVVTALGVTLPYFIQEIYEHLLGSNLFTRVSEVQELYMYYFILLYIYTLRKLQNPQV